MMRVIITLALVLVPVQTQADSAKTESYYQTGSASRDGIDKFYMGREISHFMGQVGADWLERPTREREERTDLLLKKLSFNATDHVTDLGAGRGYFSFPIARQVTAGKVLAVDIEPEMLNLIEQRKKPTRLRISIPSWPVKSTPIFPQPVSMWFYW